MYAKQKTDYYCGPASMQMLLRFFTGKNYSQACLAKTFKTTKEGTSFSDISKNLSKLTQEVQIKPISRARAKELLLKKVPVLVSFNDNPNSGHFAVARSLTAIRKCFIIHLLDPYYGDNITVQWGLFNMSSTRWYELQKK